MKLKVSKLDVSIGPRILCSGLDLNLRGGQSLAILGRNGAGKSTLLATLAGLRPIQQGVIDVDDVAITAMSPKLLAQLRGYCPQQQQDAFSATVLETALIGRHPHLGRWNWESAEDVAWLRLRWIALACWHWLIVTCTPSPAASVSAWRLAPSWCRRHSCICSMSRWRISTLITRWQC
jgi:ABC-type cobalamin/Fe3+-siderophores transport system ATPase subunit